MELKYGKWRGPRAYTSLHGPGAAGAMHPCSNLIGNVFGGNMGNHPIRGNFKGAVVGAWWTGILIISIFIG